MKCIKRGDKVKAAVDMVNDQRDRGMGLIHCAKAGDTLHVLYGGPNEYRVRNKDGYSFCCYLSEIESIN